MVRSPIQLRLATTLPYLLVLILCLIFATPGAQAKSSSAAAPTATLDSGATLIGATETKSGIAYWQGVRYAQPPTGSLRFAPPQQVDAETQTEAAPSTSGSSGGIDSNAALPLNPLKLVNQVFQSTRQAAQWAVQQTWHTSKNGLDLACRLAQRNVGSSRYARRSTTTATTVTTGPICPQAGNLDDMSEDCLFLNIYKPSSANASTLLPVIFFVHGGGWQTGAGSQFDPTPIVTAGDVMFITTNYRLNVFGFSASSDLASLAGLDSSGCTGTASNCTGESSANVGLNLGYQDVRMALNWTFTNIKAFGGDPSRIALFGQSAGAFNVGAQMLGHPGSPLAVGDDQPAGAPRPVFSAAIMMSGGPAGPALALPSQRDATWNTTLSDAGCTAASFPTALDRLNCLRTTDWVTLRNSSDEINDLSNDPGHYVLSYYPFAPVVDGGPNLGGFFSDDATLVAGNGTYADVPFMMGDVLDEGTIFTPQTLTSTDELSEWYSSVYYGGGTGTEQLEVNDALLVAYPDIPADGSPYDPKSVSPTYRFFGTTNQFKRAAALYGDSRYVASRRFFLEAALNKTSDVPDVWSWLYSYPSASAPDWVGVPHSSDLNCLFANPSTTFSNTMARQWIAFATNHDPNVNGLINWPQYDLEAQSMMTYRANGTLGLTSDTYRAAGIDLINSKTARAVMER